MFLILRVNFRYAPLYCTGCSGAATSERSASAQVGTVETTLGGAVADPAELGAEEPIGSPVVGTCRVVVGSAAPVVAGGAEAPAEVLLSAGSLPPQEAHNMSTMTRSTPPTIARRRQ